MKFILKVIKSVMSLFHYMPFPVCSKCGKRIDPDRHAWYRHHGRDSHYDCSHPERQPRYNHAAEIVKEAEQKTEPVTVI